MISHSVHLPEDKATDLKHEVQDKYRILKLYPRAIHVITVLVILIVQWLKIMNFNLKICFIVFCYVGKRENPIHEYR